MGLVIPAFIPTQLGEIVEYSPTRTEWFITWGIWAFGILLYTLLLKVAIPVLTGRLRRSSGSAAAETLQESGVACRSSH